MKAQPPAATAGEVITIMDHLWVQQRTEARAYAIWVASGCRGGAALRDWVAAEEEVLADFCRRRPRPSAPARASGQTRKMTAVEATWKRRARAVPSLFEESPRRQLGANA